MFHHFLVTIKECHYTKVSIAIESLIILCIEEMDEISQPIVSMLWVVSNLKCVPSIAPCTLVNNVFKHCEEKLMPHLYKWEKLGEGNKNDALHEGDEGIITRSFQSHEDLLDFAAAQTHENN